MSNETTYTIGKVVKRLEPAHPGLSISKVRYLESEGLVSPQRTKSGYRLYTEKDIERLDTVLRLQETCFYPLQVIREKLDAMDEGAVLPELEEGAGEGDHDEALMRTSHPLEDMPALLGIPVTPSFLRQLADVGIIDLTRTKSGRVLVDGQDIPSIRAAWELKRYGFDPRLLRTYVQQANRELPAFRQILSLAVGRQANLDDERTRETFDRTLENLLSLTGTVRDTLTCKALRREFNHPDASSRASDE